MAGTSPAMTPGRCFNVSGTPVAKRFLEGDGKMRRQITAALYSAVLYSAALGFLASSSLAIAQAQRRDRGTNTVTAPARPAPLPAGSANAARDRQVYASVKELMESIIDPSADVLWGAVGT